MTTTDNLTAMIPLIRSQSKRHALQGHAFLDREDLEAEAWLKVAYLTQKYQDADSTRFTAIGVQAVKHVYHDLFKRYLGRQMRGNGKEVLIGTLTQAAGVEQPLDRDISELTVQVETYHADPSKSPDVLASQKQTIERFFARLRDVKYGEEVALLLLQMERPNTEAVRRHLGLSWVEAKALITRVQDTLRAELRGDPMPEKSKLEQLFDLLEDPKALLADIHQAGLDFRKDHIRTLIKVVEATGHTVLTRPQVKRLSDTFRLLEFPNVSGDAGHGSCAFCGAKIGQEESSDSDHSEDCEWDQVMRDLEYLYSAKTTIGG